ncbi:MAG: SPOR domain-containing protein, partial [Hyphomicrobiaceae bacterium]
SNSRMNALTRFADLRQQYSAQLGGMTPEVQQANLGSKGSYHRLIVGPPGSRGQANRLCSELKAAGYPSCWVKSY